MRLLDTLERIAREHPVEHKILVCPNRGVGRELLRALAVRGVGWIGFEVTTPADLAMDRVATDIAAEGREVADDFARRSILDEAIDATLSGSDEESRPGNRLTVLAEGVGFREALANAVDALRLAGIDAGALARQRLEDGEKQGVLSEIARRYEEGLAKAGLVDTAGLFSRAIQKLERDDAERLDGIWLHPGLRTRGLAGRLCRRLVEQGGRVLEGEPVFGLKPPVRIGGASPGPADGARLSWLHAVEDLPRVSPGEEQAQDGPNLDLFEGVKVSPSATTTPGPPIELFAAAGPSEELKEALRRVIAAGRCWDEVEIIATDPVVYGCALDALAIRLGIPVTYAVGLPIERTRQGRAMATYLQWIQTGFPASLFRRMLEVGDVAQVSGERVGGHRLARRLRQLRIGWGQDRYLFTIDQALAALDLPEAAEDGRWTRGELEEMQSRERDELTALREILAPVLKSTPPASGPLGRGALKVAPAQLARALLVFLRHVPAGGPVEVEARERLRERLDRIGATLDRKTGFGAAMTILRSHLQIRVPSPGTEGPLPWSSAGGALHFSDLDHGGYTGRPLTFVVGLNADRFPGAGIQDPILLDSDRNILGPDALPSTPTLLAERRYGLAALLARLRGTVILSYSAWTPTEGRALAPAGEMLQALRLERDDPGLDYEALHRQLQPAAGAIPRGSGKVDGADIWMSALERDGVLLAAIPQVLESFPRLSTGLTALEARRSPQFTPHDGRIEPRVELLDPRRNADRVVSNTMLSALGECPLRYLHRYVLRIKPPDDPSLEPGAWLTALERGSLLHALYEESLERAREEGVGYENLRFEAIALETLERLVDQYRVRVPAPSEVVLEREHERMRSDVLSFVTMVRERGAEWIEPLERWFGYRPDTPPVEVALPGGAIQVGGRIDRVDALPDGRVAIVDYKTGSTFGFDASSGTYRGGRLIQHVLYTRVARKLYGRPAARMEFHFPTVKGENEVAVYEMERLEDGEQLLDTLLGMVADGHFVPTETKADCRFCDFRPICRVRTEENRVRESPRAHWAKEHQDALEEYGPLKAVRAWES